MTNPIYNHREDAEKPAETFMILERSVRRLLHSGIFFTSSSDVFHSSKLQQSADKMWNWEN